ncbi:MAG: hypothetical protein R3C28_02655 [Pirellulaceae bacterium]
MNSKPNDDRDGWNTIETFGLILGVLSVLFLFLATPQIVKFWGGLESGAEGAGEFGDQFGAVNALFSGLALLGVIIAIMLQMKELAFNGGKSGSLRKN